MSLDIRMLFAACVVIALVGSALGDTVSSDFPTGGKVISTSFEFPGMNSATWWIDKTTYVVLNHGHLFATRNGGKKWDAWTQNSATFASKGDDKTRGIVSEIHAPEKADSADEILIQTITGDTYVFNTKDGDVAVGPIAKATLSSIPKDESDASNWFVKGKSAAFDQVAFHPTQPGVAIGRIRAPNCFRAAAILCDSYAFITTPEISPKDNFAVWRYVDLHEAVTSTFWGNKNAKNFDANSVFALLRFDLQTLLDGSVRRYPISQLQTQGGGSGFEVHHNTIAAERIGGFDFVASLEKDEKGVLVPSLFLSEDNLKTVVKAEFPRHKFFMDKDDDEEGADSGYTVLDSSEDVFVNVYRGTNQRQQVWGHTFQSGIGGRRYTMSLPYNRRVRRGATTSVDFHRVRGLNGIIIANIVSNVVDSACRFCSNEDSCMELCRFASLISFDNGKEWERIKAQECKSTEGFHGNIMCSLHLHGMSSSSTMPLYPIYSSATIPGLVIATGNAGSHLDTSDSGARDVYMSRDGGASWKKIASGASVYGQTDFGGVIFTAPVESPSSSVRFSIDEGQSWNEIRVVKDDAKVFFTSSIESPHRPDAHHISLMATRETPTGYRAVSIFVDFHSTKDTECKGEKSPDTSESDFEVFTPTTNVDGCLLGQVVEYTRKKAGSTCWVHVPQHSSEAADKPYQLPFKSNVCTCTYDDYECTLGYQRKNDGTCRPNRDEAPMVFPCVGGQRMKNTGYRKMANDKCEGGPALTGETESCAASGGSPSSSASGAGAAIAVIALIALAAAAIFLSPAGGRILQFVNSHIEDKKYDAVPADEDADGADDAEFEDGTEFVDVE